MHADDSITPAHLLYRYLISLDDEELDDDWASALFAPDARVEFPMSRHTGLDGLAAYHRDALRAFAGTQHLAGPAVVDPLGDGVVRIRANLVSTHVHHPGVSEEPLFTTGSLVTCEARRISGGAWRLSALSLRVVWTTGTPPRPRDTP